MDYLQATIVTTHEATDAVSELLMRCGAHGTQIIDRSDIPDAQQIADTWALMDESVFDHMPADVWVRAWFSSPTHIENVRAMLLTLPDALAFDAGALTLTVDNVREEDWAESWKQYYKPLRIGKNLVVKPGWEAYQPQPGDKVIELDPGMAFGTGLHPSTQLCLQALEDLVRPGMTVLDVGTGSGILSIAAALLGAGDGQGGGILAVDTDWLAVAATRENAARNRLALDVRLGSLADVAERPWDLVVVNILAPVIKEMLRDGLLDYVAPDGSLLLSGIIDEQLPIIEAALAAAGGRIHQQRQINDWLVLVAAHA